MMLKVLKILKSFKLIPEDKYQQKQQIEMIKSSRLFNSQWYLDQNPDVKAKKIGPAKHYVKYGWKEGRNPSQDFNACEYMKRYPEILQDKTNPIIHYILNNNCSENKEKITKAKYDIIEKSKYWDERWYLENNPDVKKAKINPIKHYLQYGLNKRNPSRSFNGKLFSQLYSKAKDKCPLEYFEKNKKKINPFDVLLISSVPRADGVYIWRVKFIKELLEEAFKTDNEQKMGLSLDRHRVYRHVYCKLLFPLISKKSPFTAATTFHPG